MKKLLIFIIFCSSLFASKLFFMPFEAQTAKKEILQSIDQSTNFIDIAIYSFTNKSIAKHLKNAARRGVKIRIIADEQQNLDDRYSKIGYLAKYKNINIYLIKGKYVKKYDYYGKMHIKLAIFDHKKLAFGSANWSHSAFSSNYELIYFIKDYALAKKATKMFERILKRAKKY